MVFLLFIGLGMLLPEIQAQDTGGSAVAGAAPKSKFSVRKGDDLAPGKSLQVNTTPRLKDEPKIPHPCSTHRDQTYKV